MDYTEKTEKIQSPAVAIDGAKVRAIREIKKLTQLYVASVVGVTTDTISRWENNRYPSIKRENAEKLADALEAQLADILRCDSPTSADEDLTLLAPDLTTTKNLFPRGAIALLILFMLVVVVLTLRFNAATPPALSRQLPAFVAPGTVIPIKLQLESKKRDSRGFIIKEQLPPGWTVLKTHPPTTVMGPNQELKWLIPAGSADTQILYTVLAPEAAALDSSATFSGSIILQDGDQPHAAPVGGQQQTIIAGKHWADRNGDNMIDDTEIMPAYYLTEEFKGFNLDWKEIETIWNSRSYHWDMQTRTMRHQP
jgi:transcriptional regulator with XRE-family HTH domain